ncbi:hypothetical protein CEXT_168581, partial [Caerostris extrusa]
SPPNSREFPMSSVRPRWRFVRPAASNHLLICPHLLSQLHRILPAEYSTHR